MSTMSPYGGKCVVFITGASRGFGQKIAQLICSEENGILSKADAGSQIILMSRDEVQLEKTKLLIKNENFEVSIVPIDLSDIKQSQEVVNKALISYGRDFDYAFLFSNAGTLGAPEKLIPDYNNIEEIQKIFNLNVVSSSYLISRFCKTFESVKKVVVNTSSLAALQPFKSTAFYAASKACMDMFVRNLIVDCPDVTALNYAPGPLDTEMARDLCRLTSDEGTRAYFTDLFSSGKILDPAESVKKMMLTLRRNDFANGSHIDYYDV